MLMSWFSTINHIVWSDTPTRSLSITRGTSYNYERGTCYDYTRAHTRVQVFYTSEMANNINSCRNVSAEFSSKFFMLLILFYSGTNFIKGFNDFNNWIFLRCNWRSPIRGMLWCCVLQLHGHQPCQTCFGYIHLSGPGSAHIMTS